jgi:hypothetical protein
LEKNRIISGSAISRAVQDASNGKFFKYSWSEAQIRFLCL